MSGLLAGGHSRAGDICQGCVWTEAGSQVFEGLQGQRPAWNQVPLRGITVLPGLRSPLGRRKGERKTQVQESKPGMGPGEIWT